MTVRVEKHNYDGRWFNPATGVSVKIKEIKDEVFTGEPPDRTHALGAADIARRTEASMLKSYKFDSREGGIVLQEVEGNPEKVPFTAVDPSGAEISLKQPAAYAIKLRRETKALQHMMYEWTGEVTVSGRSYRVIGTGANGVFQIPANIARDYPAALHIRIAGMNGLGSSSVCLHSTAITRQIQLKLNSSRPAADRLRTRGSASAQSLTLAVDTTAGLRQHRAGG